MTTALLGLSVTLMQAQSSRPDNSKEIYLSASLSTPRTYGIQYKSSLNENTLFRLAFTNAAVDYRGFSPARSYEYPHSDFELSGGIEVGIEKRLELADRVGIFYGIDLSCYSRYHRTGTDSPNLAEDLRRLNFVSFSPGVGFKSGFIAEIKNGFMVSAEINPQLYYRYSSNEQIINSEISKDRVNAFGMFLGMETVKLSLIYRWEKKSE